MNSLDRYPVGTKLVCNEVNGVVVPNYKLPGDICVSWENGLQTSYDEDWLDTYVVKLTDFT